MYQYIVKRVLLVIPTLIGAAALVFILMRLIPGDICLVRLGSGGGTFDRDALAACHAEIGIDRPLIVQFLDFVWGFLRFDFGTSMWSGKPVILEIATRLPISLEIAMIATVIAIADRDPARHDLGAEAEHLDRSRGAHLLDRRHRHAVVLARHHFDPDRARHHAT